MLEDEVERDRKEHDSVEGRDVDAGNMELTSPVSVGTARKLLVGIGVGVDCLAPRPDRADDAGNGGTGRPSKPGRRSRGRLAACFGLTRRTSATAPGRLALGEVATAAARTKDMSGESAGVLCKRWSASPPSSGDVPSRLLAVVDGVSARVCSLIVASVPLLLEASPTTANKLGAFMAPAPPATLSRREGGSRRDFLCGGPSGAR